MLGRTKLWNTRASPHFWQTPTCVMHQAEYNYRPQLPNLVAGNRRTNSRFHYLAQHLGGKKDFSTVTEQMGPAVRAKEFASVVPHSYPRPRPTLCANSEGESIDFLLSDDIAPLQPCRVSTVFSDIAKADALDLLARLAKREQVDRHV